MKTHTPGPWATSRDAVPDGYVQITVYAEATGNRVATAFEDEGNAPLISAAPDLLAALQDAVKSLEWAAMVIKDIPPKSAFMEGLAEARATIAKAQP